MKRNTYYPQAISDQIIWLTNFANKLPALAVTLGLTPAQAPPSWRIACGSSMCCRKWFPAAHKFSTGATQAAAEVQFGDGSALMVLPRLLRRHCPATPWP